MSVDRERAQVYAAEIAAFDGTDLEQIVGIKKVTRAIDSTLAGEWWPGGAVDVRAARSDAQSSATHCALDDGSTATIAIAAPQATVATGAHELAHALAGVARGHDAIYRRACLDVVQVMTNPDRLDGRAMLHVDQLADAYAAAGLDVGERAWPEPPSVGGAIAL
jgi:hypothetical protein